MSKIRIYIEPQNIENLVEIRNKEIIHKIKDVLRLKENDNIYVFDGKGKEYLYIIKGINSKSILIKKRKKEKDEFLPQVRVFLGFPVIRKEKIDFILQKATELGVDGFIPFICARSLPLKSLESKLRRWEKIVREAVRQCGRLWIPQIYRVLRFEEIIHQEFSLKLAASIEGENPQDVLVKKAKDILVVVGPEGDFTSCEFEELKKAQFKFIKLSKHILRTETAAIFAGGLITQIITEKYTDGHR